MASNGYSATFGSGPIIIDQDFRDHFQGYLVQIKSNPNYVFVYTANNEGDSFWQAWTFGNWQKATEESLAKCNELAKKNGNSKCKVLAKGSKIFWKWNQIEEELFKNKKEIISSNDVSVMVGTGNIKLSDIVENEYKLAIQQMRDFNSNDSKFVFYLAVSPSGNNYGLMTGSIAKSGVSGNKIKDDIKKVAIANCMTKNNGKQCYLYSSHDGILWKF